MDTNEITRRYLDSLLVEERLIDSVLPSGEVTLFGRSYATPIMTPAFSHLGTMGEGREPSLVEYARAAKEMGALNWVGMVTDEDLAEILRTGADTVRIIKPFADHEKIRSQIRAAEELGAAAVGIDIDHVYGDDGRYDVVDGEQMGPISSGDLRDLAGSTALPFVVKGVLSASDARKCAACGAAGIVVSHHHGRMRSAVPPLLVLPEIRAAVAGTGTRIFVDCHIDDGVDAFKALALGADAVSLGRAILGPLKKEGVAGVLAKLRKSHAELLTMMGYAGIRSVGEMDPSVIHPVPSLL